MRPKFSMSCSQKHQSASARSDGDDGANTYTIMEVEETGERLEGQTLGLVSVRYLEQIRHIEGWWSGASCRESDLHL
jgi:hypothetical protein